MDRIYRAESTVACPSRYVWGPRCGLSFSTVEELGNVVVVLVAVQIFVIRKGRYALLARATLSTQEETHGYNYDTTHLD